MWVYTKKLFAQTLFYITKGVWEHVFPHGTHKQGENIGNPKILILVWVREE